MCMNAFFQYDTKYHQQIAIQYYLQFQRVIYHVSRLLFLNV